MGNDIYLIIRDVLVLGVCLTSLFLMIIGVVRNEESTLKFKLLYGTICIATVSSIQYTAIEYQVFYSCLWLVLSINIVADGEFIDEKNRAMLRGYSLAFIPTVLADIALRQLDIPTLRMTSINITIGTFIVSLLGLKFIKNTLVMYTLIIVFGTKALLAWMGVSDKDLSLFNLVGYELILVSLIISKARFDTIDHLQERLFSFNKRVASIDLRHYFTKENLMKVLNSFSKNHSSRVI